MKNVTQHTVIFIPFIAIAVIMIIINVFMALMVFTTLFNRLGEAFYFYLYQIAPNIMVGVTILNLISFHYIKPQNIYLWVLLLPLLGKAVIILGSIINLFAGYFNIQEIVDTVNGIINLQSISIIQSLSCIPYYIVLIRAIILSRESE